MNTRAVSSIRIVKRSKPPASQAPAVPRPEFLGFDRTRDQIRHYSDLRNLGHSGRSDAYGSICHSDLIRSLDYAADTPVPLFVSVEGVLLLVFVRVLLRYDESLRRFVACGGLSRLRDGEQFVLTRNEPFEDEWTVDISLGGELLGFRWWDEIETRDAWLEAWDLQSKQTLMGMRALLGAAR